MRVIGGVARGRKLLPVPGDGTRPITDRAKEALFSILQGDVPGARVLDLFAGTGSVGIEALSRGADWADFVEMGAAAHKVLRDNLDKTGLAAQAGVLRRDVFDFLTGRPAEPYDVVYVAPPQYKGLWSKTLTALDKAPHWVAPDGLVVAQIHPREERALELANFELEQRRQYGSVALLFFVPVEPPE
jgi:16S rRNA (guanine966-N2)-methyltransferase